MDVAPPARSLPLSFSAHGSAAERRPEAGRNSALLLSPSSSLMGNRGEAAQQQKGPDAGGAAAAAAATEALLARDFAERVAHWQRREIALAAGLEEEDVEELLQREPEVVVPVAQAAVWELVSGFADACRAAAARFSRLQSPPDSMAERETPELLHVLTAGVLVRDHQARLWRNERDVWWLLLALEGDRLLVQNRGELHPGQPSPGFPFPAPGQNVSDVQLVEAVLQSDDKLRRAFLVQRWLENTAAALVEEDPSEYDMQNSIAGANLWRDTQRQNRRGPLVYMDPDAPLRSGTTEDDDDANANTNANTNSSVDAVQGVVSGCVLTDADAKDELGVLRAVWQRLRQGKIQEAEEVC
jgi:Nuclear pore protein 84 / 107